MQLKRGKGRFEMEKVVIFLIYFCFSFVYSNAQLTENDWIKPSQKYLKISVTEDGIYKISGAEMQAAGWKIADIKEQNLQLYYRGNEISLFLATANDSRFEVSDYLLFYGKKNDGSRDSLLYRNTERANPYHSLYSDASAYFLTIGDKAGKRVEVKNSTTKNLPDEPFHLAEDIIAFDEQFSFNNSISLVPLLQQSYFEHGEGRTGKYIVSDSVANFIIPFHNRVLATNYKPVITYRINGRSRVMHQLVSSFGSEDSTKFNIQPFGFSTQTKEIQERFISKEALNFSLFSTKKEPLDWYSATFFKAVYPQHFLMDNKSVKYFNLVSNITRAIAVRIADLNTNALVWEVSDATHPIWILPSAANQYIVEDNLNAVKLLVAKQAILAKSITPVTFRSLNEFNADYLIITHKSLLNSAETYAKYRTSAAGGNYKPLTTTSQELYDTFNYGEDSPVALRKFAEFMVKTQKPRQLLLMGRGVSFPDEFKKSTYPNLVPTIGYPASDALISAGLGGFPEDVQAIPTGRLNVSTNGEVTNYLDKVITVEANEKPEIWQKNILHLSGGQNENEISNLRSILNDIKPTAEGGLLGGKIEVQVKKTNLEIEPIDISKAVNTGLGMITFAGHGSANQLDLNIGYCSPPQNGFANEGKYPIMFFNGCGVGNVFYRYNTLSTDWLLAPKKGAIAIFANSFWSYAYPTQQYLNVLYKKLFDDPKTVNLTLGEIQQAAHLQLINENTNDYIKANVHQVILQGDPALRIFPIAKPDYKVVEKSLVISSLNESQTISKNDSIKIGVIIQNAGKYEKNNTLPIQLTMYYQDGSSANNEFAFKSIAYQDTILLKIKHTPKLKKIEVSVNPKNEIPEYNFENNSGTLEFPNWEAIGNLTSYPQNILPDNLSPILSVLLNNKLPENEEYISSSAKIDLELTDNQSLDSTADYHLNVLLRDCETCNFTKLELPQRPANVISSNILKTSFNLANLVSGTYDLLINARDMAGNTLTKPYEVRFNISEKTFPHEVVAFPNPARDFVQIQCKFINPELSEKARLTVYNNAGQEIYEEEVQTFNGQNNYFIKTKNLPSGRFFVRITVGETELITTSFIVK